MRSTFLRAVTVTTAVVSTMAGGAAFADCQPDPAASGQTVTCSGTDADGFAAGAAQNLTLNVLGGATVTSPAGNALVLNAGNVVTNSGTILAPANFASAILLAGSGNTVANLGMIAASGSSGNGINADSSNGNTITNLSSIAASGVAVSGIFLGSSSLNTVTNGGTITASGNSANGIVLLVNSNNNRVVNNGMIVASGDFTTGVVLNFSSAGNAIENPGTIVASGQSAFAILVESSSNNTVSNRGTITASGPGSVGILIADAAGTTANNLGTITASGQGATGVWVGGAGATASIISNAGAIRATGADAMALLFDQSASGIAFTNAAGGLVFADAGVNAVATAGTTGTGTLTNNGTIDGRMTATGIAMVNAGLIQISTGTVGQAHAIGAFTQLAAGTLALRVNPAGAHDSLGTSGTTVLGGTLRAVMQPGLYNNVTLYPNVVTATAGLGGAQFASVVSTSLFFTASAAYAPNAVNLTLTRIAFGALPGLTQNQQAIGNALEAGYSTAATGIPAAIYTALLGSTTAPSYDGVSGEVGTGVQNPSFAMGDAFFGSLFGQTQRWRSGMSSTGAPGTQSASGTYRVQFATAQPSFELAESYAQAAPSGAGPWPPRSVGPHWAAWASGFGLSGNRNGDGTVGSARLGYTMGGGAFGADVQLNPNLLLGGAVSGAGSDFTLDGRAASGTAHTGFFGLYGSWTMGPLYIDAAASYGLASFTTSRLATLGTTAETATGSFDGHQVGGRVEAGWRFMIQRFEFAPFAGVTVQSLHQDGYNETSTNVATGAAGTLGLSYQSQTTTSVRSLLGGQVATTFQLGERTTITPRARAAWAHEFDSDRLVSASLLSIPAAAFTVNGARPARDAALVSAGVDIGIGRKRDALRAVRQRAHRCGQRLCRVGRPARQLVGAGPRRRGVPVRA
jgi:outer membrane autotransporter protein